MESVRIVQEGESYEPYDYSFLIIGASGNGKTAFVNAFINYLLGRTPMNLIPVIPSTHYPKVDERFIDRRRRDRNDEATGKSQTQYTHCYKVSSAKIQGKTLLICDTPGLVSDGGVGDDDQNLQDIIRVASTVKSFNAIIFIEKSCTNRLSPPVDYNISRIAEIIPSDFANKLIVVLTFHTAGDPLFQDNWIPYKIQLKAKINNTAFLEKPSKLKKEKSLKRIMGDWEKFSKKTNEILLKAIDMRLQSTVQYRSIFDIQNRIMEKIAEYQLILENTEKIRYYLVNPTSALQIKIWEATSKHNTLCVRHLTLCHESCKLNLNESHGTSYFNDCACMNLEKRCQECGCISEQHTHMKKKPIIINDINEKGLLIYLRESANFRDSSIIPKKILKKLEIEEEKIITCLHEEEIKLHMHSPNYRLSDYFEKAARYLEIKKKSRLTNDQEIKLDDEMKVCRITSQKLKEKAQANQKLPKR